MQIYQEWLKNRVDFSRVVMTDEKVFRLDGPDNWFSYYGSKGNKQMRLLRQRGGSSIMCTSNFLRKGAKLRLLYHCPGKNYYSLY